MNRDPGDTKVGDSIVSAVRIFLVAFIIIYAAIPELRDWFAITCAP